MLMHTLFILLIIKDILQADLYWKLDGEGLEMGGIVDFDVLDGLEEFWDASRLLDLKGCVGIESRVFVPEFADREINSP